MIEQPSPPAAPRVTGISGSTDSVRLTWDAPANTGPSVTAYEVQYKEAGARTGFLRWTHFGVDRSTIITGLKAGTRYEVQVRARSVEGTSDWSRSGTGAPNPDVANRRPAFSGGSRSLSVPENTPSNTDVGAPIAATDRDGDTLTYTLEGTDAGSFVVLSTSEGAPDTDKRGAEPRREVELLGDGSGKRTAGVEPTRSTSRSGVTDVGGESPDTPFAPTVTAISSTSLHVSWEVPDNQGPRISDYDYRYRGPSGSWTEITNTTITGTTVTIERPDREHVI